MSVFLNKYIFTISKVKTIVGGFAVNVRLDRTVSARIKKGRIVLVTESDECFVVWNCITEIIKHKSKSECL
jgi:hypothetical protein